MRRHLSMDQLAHDVLRDVVQAERVKSASAAPVALKSALGELLVKVATELRSADGDSLTYDDVVKVAEDRRAKR